MIQTISDVFETWAGRCQGCLLWWIDFGWMPGVLQAALLLPFSAGQDTEKIRKATNLMCQDEGSLLKQKQRSCAEAKENENIFSLLPINR